MKTVIAVIIMFFFAGVAIGAEDDTKKWTAGDTALQMIFLTELDIDRAQSVYAFSPAHKNEHEEVGLLRIVAGKHPTPRQVNFWCATSAIAHTAIAYYLPKPYRTIWQSFWIGVEVDVIHSTTVDAGISIRF